MLRRQRRAQLLSGLGDRRARMKARVASALRCAAVALIGVLFLPPVGAPPADAADGTAPTTGPTTAPVALPAGPGGIPGEVIEALKSLRSNKADDREKAYAILSEKGDARILAAINSFFRGELHLRDASGKTDKKGDRLAMYAPGVNLPGGGQVFPVLDALTGAPIAGPDGQPLQVANRPDLSSAFTRPLNAIQQKPVLQLRAFLSLLHPDPVVRRTSIREAGERAARVFPDPADEEQLKTAMRRYADVLKQHGRLSDDAKAIEAEPQLLATFEAAYAEKPSGLFGPAPSKDAAAAVARPLDVILKAGKAAKHPDGRPIWPEANERPTDPRVVALMNLSEILPKYRDRIDTLEKNLEDLPRTAEALKKQLAADPNGSFADAYAEAIAQMDAVLGDDATRLAAIPKLGEFGTMRAANVLRKLQVAAGRSGDASLAAAITPALEQAEAYQRNIRLVQYTFFGLSTGSIYVLLALGLAIIFGLMGVINMAHGEFMMVGAFSTYAVASLFRSTFPGAYDFFPLAAVPAAFVVAGLVGIFVEFFVIRYLYGRTTDTLVATIGIGIVLIWAARKIFGDNLSVSTPSWMQGSWEAAPDLLLNKARLCTILYCVLCILVVYFIVNRTRLGLLLRATTQNRKMAAALGVPTRGVDALTFGFGAGLAGMAGVIVPMIDKINPNMGQDYVVMSFMVVVVGGVGKLAGAIIAGLGLGLIGNYLEPALGSITLFARTSSVLSKVVVLAAIVIFLQKRPSGLFPPKGRAADA